MTNYDYVILDSAIFKNRFSKNATDFILSNVTIMSKTFFLETKEYAAILDNKLGSVLAQNLQTIITSIKTRNYQLTVSNEPFDVFQRSIELSRLNYKVCVMTEDLILIERISQSKNGIDVYDLNKDKIIRNTAAQSKPITVYVDYSSSNERIRDINVGSQLITESNQTITLGDKLGTSISLEGKLFYVKNKSDIVVKIYKSYPSPEKQEHVKRLAALNKQLNIHWCVFPLEPVYYQGRMVGFTMRKVVSNKLSCDTLFLGDIPFINEDRLSLKRSYTLNFCKTLLIQVKILGCYGICISDYNDENFSTYSENFPIIMYDTDSFAFGPYYGNTVEDSRYSRKYNYKIKEELCQLCDEGTLKMTFKLLSLGFHPFVAENQPYRFTNKSGYTECFQAYFPDNVLRYLGDVFSAKVIPSLSIALYNIGLALDELRLHPEKNVTIFRMCEESYKSFAPFTVSTGNDIFGGKKEHTSATTTPVKKEHTSTTTTPVKKDYTPIFDPEPIPEAASESKPRHRFWPWAISALLLLGGIGIYYLISQGIIPW